ncbi:MAG: Uma2 family endonuclease [Microcystaceae cyanobacterium]
MVLAIPKTQPITFEKFLLWKPENALYELHNGVISEMPQPLGKYEEITSFIAEKMMIEYLRLKFPYRLAKTVLIKPIEKESAYLPDVLILNHPNLINEPLWEKSSTVTTAASIPLVVEVVSSNWRVDYLTKLKDYEEMGIFEYWIIDYLGLGGKRVIGDPKRPTILIYQLIEEEYQVMLFQRNDKIISPTFPDLNLTANQIFQAGNSEKRLS